MRGPHIKLDTFGADLANALLLRPVYRKPRVRAIDNTKRLTDSELAAEYWAFDFEDFDKDLRADPDECSGKEWADYIRRRNEAEAALKRFATLPHYDEAPSEGPFSCPDDAA